MGMAASNKAYDGLTDATLTGGFIVTGVAGETLTFANQTGIFASKNVANGIAVTVANTTLENGIGGLASNYSLIQPTVAVANITTKAQAATIAAARMIYDGTLTAAPVFTVSGLVITETVTATGAATFNTTGNNCQSGQGDLQYACQWR